MGTPSEGAAQDIDVADDLAVPGSSARAHGLPTMGSGQYRSFLG